MKKALLLILLGLPCAANADDATAARPSRTITAATQPDVNVSPQVITDQTSAYISTAPAAQVAKSTQTATELVDRAVSFAMSRHFEEALDAFTAAERLEPDNATIEMQIGLTLRRLGRFDEAEQKLLRSLKLDPKLKPARESLALFYEHKAAHAPPGCKCRENFLRQSREEWMEFSSLASDKAAKKLARKHIERIEELLQ
jgi:tetratricopeptide (TPR) repeat protein